LFQAPELITGLGLDASDLYGPSLSADGKTLYFDSTDVSGDHHIYVATRTDRGTDFSAGKLLAAVNATNSDGCPSISNDGLNLYFFSTRPGGAGGRDLWVASRSTVQGKFGTPKVLTSVNDVGDDNLQWISADELTIIFSSVRNAVLAHLYIAHRSSKIADFSTPVALGGVNGTTSREDRAALSNDGLTLYFTSNRTGGAGDRDIWVATRPNTQSDFANVTNLQAINSTARDADVALSADETEMVFSSKRSGQFRLYRSIRNCQ
jgi:Tol biopolymer transport system component